MLYSNFRWPDIVLQHEALSIMFKTRINMTWWSIPNLEKVAIRNWLNELLEEQAGLPREVATDFMPSFCDSLLNEVLKGYGENYTRILK